MVVSAASLDELDSEEVESRVAEFWTSFSSSELPDLVAELQPAVESLTPA